MPLLADLFAATQQKHLQASETNDIVLLRECYEEYNAFLNQAPDEPAFIFAIATLNMQFGYNAQAIAQFKRCIDLDPNQANFWNNLGSAYKNEHMDDEAEKCWLKANELHPSTEYLNNLSVLHINRGHPETGIEFAEKAIEMDPKNIKANWNYSLLLLEQQDYKNGFVQYEAGLLTKDRMNKLYDAKNGTVPYYEGQDLSGKTIVVFGEQGIGDEVLYATAIPDLIATGANIIYDCHDRLESVMKRSFPEIDIRPNRKDYNSPEWAKDMHIDYRLAIGSLFRFFGVRKRPPYLEPDPELVEKYRTKMENTGPAPYVGIGYAGGHKKTHGHERSFKLSDLTPVIDGEATLISLQYTREATEKLKNHFIQTGRKIHHWPMVIYSHLDDAATDKADGYNYENTIALIAALDYCVLPNTSAVHVCGAVGTTCYTLTPDAKAWRYCSDDNHMNWYQDHVTQIYQDGDWDKAIKTLAEALK